MSDKSLIHQGHRKRLKERFCLEGLDHFNEINVLEMLLFYCIPRQDTNALAHRLLERFGSFSNVLEAPREELMEVKGVAENVAIYLSMIREVSRYYEVGRSAKNGNEPVVLDRVDDIGEYMKPYFIGRTRETVFLLCLDSKCRVICCKKIGEGSVNTAALSIRKVVEVALNSHAVSVAVAHNHPSGFALPSPEDIQTTKQLEKALQAVDIVLVDHLIYAEDDYVSIALSAYYRPERNWGMTGERE